MDESEHTVLQVHIDDDTHVADFPDVVPGAEEDQVPLAQVAETLHGPAHLELGVGVVREVHPELLEDGERESRAIVPVGTAGAEPVGNADESLGVVQHLIDQRLRGLRNGHDALRRADPFLGPRHLHPGLDQVDGIHHRLRPFPRPCDILRIRQGRNGARVRP